MNSKQSNRYIMICKWPVRAIYILDWLFNVANLNDQLALHGILQSNPSDLQYKDKLCISYSRTQESFCRYVCMYVCIYVYLCLYTQCIQFTEIANIYSCVTYFLNILFGIRQKINKYGLHSILFWFLTCPSRHSYIMMSLLDCLLFLVTLSN